MYDEHDKARREEHVTETLKQEDKDVFNEGIDPDVGLFSIQPESFNLHDQKESKFSNMGGYDHMDDENEDIDEMYEVEAR